MFSIISKHNDTYDLYWQRYKNSTVAVPQIFRYDALYSSNGQLQYSRYILNSDPSVFHNQFPHSRRIHAPCTAQPPSRMSTWPFCNSLCCVFITLPLHTSSKGGEFWWLKHVLLIKPNHTMNFLTGPHFQSRWHCTSTYPLNSIRVPDSCHQLHVTHTTSTISYQTTSTNVTG
jgi:hypothetical protein